MMNQPESAGTEQIDASPRRRKKRKAANVQAIRTSAGQRYRAHMMLDGKRLYGPCRDTVDEAQQDALGMRQRKETIPSRLLTVQEGVDLLMAESERLGKSAGTLRSYKQQTRVLLHYFDGAAGLHTITRHDIERFFDLRIKRDQVSPNTAVQNFAILRRILTIAHKKGHLAELPHRNVEVPTVRQARINCYTAEEVQEILRVMRRSRFPSAARDASIVEFLFFSGLRLSEIARLHVADVDLTSGIVFVRGKRGRRELQVSESLRPVAAAMLIGRHHDDPLLDASTEARRVSLVSKLFARWSGKLRKGSRAKPRLPDGLATRFHPHALRHSFATSLLRAGARLFEVQALLGHRGINMTLRYAHASGQDLRSAVNRLKFEHAEQAPKSGQDEVNHG